MFFILFIYLTFFQNSRITGNFIASLSCFIIYSIQPMFYFNGDVNFRRRAHQHGIWRALKKELFPNHTEIQPVNTF